MGSEMCIRDSLKRLSNPSGFEGLKSQPSKPQRLGDKTSKNVSTLSRALSLKGFKGFRVINEKRFQGIPHTNAPDGAYHVPMRFSQVVKVSRAGHRTSHTSMSTLSKTLQSSKSAPQGPEFFQPVFEPKALILERLHLSVHLRIAFPLAAM